MKSNRFIVATLATIAASVALCSSAAAAMTAFVGVNVVPMDAPRVLRDQTVIVEGGVIVAMGDPALVQPPRRAQIVRGEGRYLAPGLADMHTHLAGYVGEAAAGDNPAIAANQLLMYVATGVTLVRDMSGTPAHRLYRARIESGEWVGPDLYYTSPIVEGAHPVWNTSIQVTDPSAVEALVAGFARDGYWGVKVYHTVSRDVFDALLAAAARHRLPVVGHVPFEVGIDRAIAAGQYGIEHFRGYDFDGVPLARLEIDGGRSAERFGSWLRMSDARRTQLIHDTVAAGVWNTPTLVASRFLYDAQARQALARNPRFAMAHPSLRAQVLGASGLDRIFPADARAAMRAAEPRILAMTKALNDAGGRLLVGTDAVLPAYVPGFTPIDEIETFVTAGVSNFDALRAATALAAQSLGVGDRMGTIAVGKRANLILLDGNPLEDVSHLWELSGVMVRGRWFSFQDLQIRLATMAAGFEPVARASRERLRSH